jgi:hypothetical protein
MLCSSKRFFVDRPIPYTCCIGTFELEYRMATLSPHNQAKLRQVISEFELEPLEPWLLKHATECVLLHVSDRDPYRNMGNSRIGGMPDLPPSLPWPAGPNGARFSFIMQINLAEISAIQGENSLRSGRLHVFVGDDEDSTNVAHTLVYDQSPPNTLTRKSVPDQRELANENLIGLKPHLIKSEVALSLPGITVLDQARGQEIAINDALLDRYMEMGSNLNPGRGELPCQFLGYTAFFGDEVTAGVEERLLLRIESNKHVGLWWWDAGFVEILIRDCDLVSERFDNTRMVLFSS